MTSAVTVAKQRLIEAGLATADSIQGCTEENIACIESWVSVRLPAAYRDFLLEMGRNAGDFLVGSDFLFADMLWFRTSAEELIAACGSTFSLWSTDYIFFFHDPSFSFLDCEAGDDPPVYMFNADAEPEPRKTFDSFSGWLLAAVEGEIDIRRENELRRQELRRQGADQ